MPFTFFAHQLPVLPLARHGGRRFDGIALATGSMAPDLAYALWLTPLSFNSHALMAQLWWSTPMAAVLAVVTRRLLIAPVAAALPDTPPFYLRDYAHLAAVRKSLPVTFVSALIGALSHVGLDAFTHSNGYVVKHWSLLREVFYIGGVELPVWNILQYTGHLFGSLICIALLARYGRQRWLMCEEDSSVVRQSTRVRLPSSLRTSLIAGLAIGVGAALLSLPHHGAIAAFIRFIWLLFIAAAVGSGLVLRAKSSEAARLTA